MAVLSQRDATDVAARIIALWPDQDRNDHVHRYVKGEHDLPYAPKTAKAHYLWLLRKSRTNWCKLLVDIMSQNLYVDGYRAASTPEGSEIGGWSYWTRNRMARRQSGVHRAALKYGHAFVAVTPGDPVPMVRGASPRTMTAVYADESADEWPVYAVQRGTSWGPAGPAQVYRLYDDQAVYFLAGDQRTGELSYVEAREHGLGVTPVVRFTDEEDLDGDHPGVVAPFIDVQDRFNLSVFQQLMSQEHGAHRQRWAAGLELDDGAEPPIGPDRLLHSDSPETRFGTFDATDLTGYVAVLDQILRHLAALTQTPPPILLASLSNLAADALEKAEAGLQRRVGERRTSYGESWDQVLRLCALADGDAAGWSDMAAEVRWRDTGMSSLAAVADAWGKAVTMLGIPARAAWEHLPGVTDNDITRWENMPAEPDGSALLADVLGRATQGG